MSLATLDACSGHDGRLRYFGGGMHRCGHARGMQGANPDPNPSLTLTLTLTLTLALTLTPPADY
jgi:hypothetical protein